MRTPQHLVTVIEDINRNDQAKNVHIKSSWPKEWIEQPKILDLVHAHETWLTHPVTQKMFELITSQLDKRCKVCADLSTSPGVSDSVVRVAAGEIHAILQLDSILRDTKKFVEALTT